MAIGRLDEDSEGLLLLTTDGMMSEIIRSKKDKEYFVQVDGVINQQAIDQIKKGVEIGFNGTKYKTKPCQSFILNEILILANAEKNSDDRHGPTSWASITQSTKANFAKCVK
jgi:23S rRNA pseudouridine2457 synthase